MKTKPNVPKKTYPSEDQIQTTGMNLHAALRKCCDSKPTSAVWNIIYALHRDIWHSFCKAMVGAKTGRDLLRRFEAWDQKEAWDVENTLPKDGTNDRNIAVAFRCMLKCFDVGDWEGFAAFIGEE
jgi:hypothetical protein